MTLNDLRWSGTLKTTLRLTPGDGQEEPEARNLAQIDEPGFDALHSTLEDAWNRLLEKMSQ